MELIYEGKTKDVYRKSDNNILLQFKDDVTGEDGVFDPGANTVGLRIDGVGKSGLKMTTYFFELLAKKNIPTHFIATDLDEVTMTVKDAEMFGKGLEVICRYRAVGSFYRRYASICEEGQKLDGFVEVTLKDDDKGDPPIAKDALVMLGVVTEEEYEAIEKMTKEVCELVKEVLAEKGLSLYDMKLEFGRNKETKEVMLIDEISGGNMRVYDEKGVYVEPLDLEKRLFA